MTEVRIAGGCQCGAVRYAVHAPLFRPSICHCRMCQKAFGAFYAPLVSAPLDAFELTRGTLGIFKSSDLVERGFCRDCGTPLSFRYVDGDKIDIAIGSLDDPTKARPIVQHGLESRMPWLGDLVALPGQTTEKEDAPGLVARIRDTNQQHPDHDTATWPPQGADR